MECFYSWRDSTADITTHTRVATRAGVIVGAQKAAKRDDASSLMLQTYSWGPLLELRAG